MPPIEEYRPSALGRIAEEAVHIADDIVGLSLYEHTKVARNAIEMLQTQDFHFKSRYGHIFLFQDRQKEYPLIFEPADPIRLVWPEDNTPKTVSDAIALELKHRLAKVNFDQHLETLTAIIQKKTEGRQARSARENAALIVRSQHIANILRAWRHHPDNNLQTGASEVFNEAVTWQRDVLATEQGKLLHNIIRSMSDFNLGPFLKHMGSTLATDAMLAALSITTPSTWPLTLAKMFIKPLHGYTVAKTGQYKVYGESPTNNRVVGWFTASEDDTSYKDAYRKFAQFYKSLPLQYKIIDPLDPSGRTVIESLPMDERSMELVAVALFTSLPDRAFCRINSLASQMNYSNAQLMKKLHEMSHPTGT